MRVRFLLVVAALALALFGCDRVDQERYTTCIKSHMETHLEPVFGYSMPGDIKVTSNMALKTRSVCDARATFECVGWRQVKGWFDTTHTQCVEYKQKEE